MRYAACAEFNVATEAMSPYDESKNRSISEGIAPLRARRPTNRQWRSAVVASKAGGSKTLYLDAAPPDSIPALSQRQGSLYRRLRGFPQSPAGTVPSGSKPSSASAACGASAPASPGGGQSRTQERLHHRSHAGPTECRKKYSRSLTIDWAILAAFGGYNMACLSFGRCGSLPEEGDHPQSEDRESSSVA